MQLALLNKKKLRKLDQKGFTLVELLIVVVVLGVLSAVALPNFLGANDRAKRNASLTSTIEMSKECSSEILLDDGTTTYTFTTYNTNDLVTVITACNNTPSTDGGKFETVVAQNAKPNTLCGADPATTSKNTTCTITVEPNGERKGEWS
jgi:type IV pilus assembly protein PilA